MKPRKAQIFFGTNKNIAAHIFFIDSGSLSKKKYVKYLDIILPGLPQTPNFSGIEKFVEQNRAIVYIHYPGTWYSGGFFTPKEIEKMLNECTELFTEGKFIDVYTNEMFYISSEIKSFIGNSFGGYFAHEAKNPFRRILLAPFLPSVKRPDMSTECLNVLDQVTVDINLYRKSLLYCYRGITEDAWNDFAYRELQNNDASNLKIYFGTEDTLISKNYIEEIIGSAIKLKPVNSGHDFLALYQAYVEDTDE